MTANGGHRQQKLVYLTPLPSHCVFSLHQRVNSYSQYFLVQVNVEKFNYLRQGSYIFTLFLTGLREIYSVCFHKSR